MITQRAKLNLIPGVVLPRLNIVQYDKGSRTLEFEIWNGQQRFTLTNLMTARIQGTKPDRHGFDYSATVDTTNNIIVSNVTQQMTAAKGDAICEIVLNKGTERIGSLNFVLDIQPAALNDDTDVSESDLPDIIAMATEQMLTAEAYAKGTQDGVPVTSEQAGYHDNSKYYKDLAATSETNAANSATAAAQSATSADTNALKSEGFAVGKQNNVDVPSTSPYYHKNAKYYAEVAGQYSVNTPYIGPNGNWWVWNTTTSTYVDSGVDASITVQIADITMLPASDPPYVTNTGTDTDPIFHLFIPQGVGITGVTYSSSVGLEDYYIITFSDNTTTSFTVTNGATGAAAGFGTPTASVDTSVGTPSVIVTASGPDTAKIFDFAFHNLKGATGATGPMGPTGPTGNGIVTISKTSTSGLEDTYTITYSDGTTTTFPVVNGKGISSITKTGTSGLVDTYTITYNSGSPTTFQVVNGKTAYQSAVAGGYSGSEQDFENDLANFETWATNSANSATAAANSATAAAGSATSANQSYLDAKAQADRAQVYANFLEPHFIIQNNRLYIKDDAVGEFVTANNRLYMKLVS